MELTTQVQLSFKTTLNLNFALLSVCLSYRVDRTYIGVKFIFEGDTLSPQELSKSQMKERPRIQLIQDHKHGRIVTNQLNIV